MKTKSDFSPRIYVACLASYNAGKLHGAWIDLGSGVDVDDIMESIADMIEESPSPGAEEWAIHDYDDMPGFSDEHPNLGELCEAAELIEDRGEIAGKLLEEYTLEEAKRYLEDGYQGQYESVEEWAEQFLEDTGALSGMTDQLKWYFDFCSYARDCELSGDIFTIEIHHKEVHVFWSNC